ncbi:MAG: hypothetical protein Q8904_09325 [Bacteroidota bacterium]|nr:hypothetical protein [Bacteroidota bacterium]
MTTILMTYLFVPEIWGTVSDWVMIAVTFATALLLLLTLKSQKKVQQTQNELFRIEKIRFKESIKPMLKYSVSKDQAKSDNKNRKLLTIEVINETSSSALKISRFVADNEQTIQLFSGIVSLDSKCDHLTKGDKPLLFHFGINLESAVFSHYIIFIMKYQDIAETKYQQRVICIYDEDYGIEIHPSLPEITS